MGIKVGTLLENGTVENQKEFNQNDLTSECWSVQFSGEDACTTCELKDTDECGGKSIRETNKNSKGITMPLNDIS